MCRQETRRAENSNFEFKIGRTKVVDGNGVDLINVGRNAQADILVVIQFSRTQPVVLK